MDLFLITFESIALLLVIGCGGFMILKRNILPESAFSFLSPLSLDIALPCLVFANIITNFQPLAFPGWWLLPLWWAGFTVISSGAALLFGLFARPAVKKEFIVSLMYPNAIFFPLAILTGMFGNDSPHVVNLFLFVLFFPSFLFSTCHLFWKKTNPPVRWICFFPEKMAGAEKKGREKKKKQEKVDDMG
ncbi:MAG: AEC family transporter, partial [Desulfobacteraceae bacterium]